jgi:hypothetical protein
LQEDSHLVASFLGHRPEHFDHLSLAVEAPYPLLLQDIVNENLVAVSNYEGSVYETVGVVEVNIVFDSLLEKLLKREELQNVAILTHFDTYSPLPLNLDLLDDLPHLLSHVYPIECDINVVIVLYLIILLRRTNSKIVPVEVHIPRLSQCYSILAISNQYRLEAGHWIECELVSLSDDFLYLLQQMLPLLWVV